MRSSGCYDGIGKGPVAEDIESTWYFGQATEWMMLCGRLPATSTTLRSYKR